MSLVLPSIARYTIKNKYLLDLITQFNQLPEEEHFKRIFFLQKINYALNMMPLNIHLINWINDTQENSWSKHLEQYGINPHSSFFMKGLQFAKAVHDKMKQEERTKVEQKFQNKLAPQTNQGYEYLLMQERDALLKTESITECEERYIENCYQQTVFSERDKRIQARAQLHIEVLEMAKKKIAAVLGKDTSAETGPTPSYHTKVLGAHANNNANFHFQMGGWKDPFVIRVEDRAELELEQDLHSYAVATYFLEEYAQFRIAYSNPDNVIELKPVALSQFATQGSLDDVAIAMHQNKESIANIGPQAADYFLQLSHFFLKLMEAKTYHPDIKLTNFLVHNNLIRVSDRKTFVREENPLVHTLRISPEYAPDEIVDCLNEDWTGYCEEKDVANIAVNMPAVMAYQLGAALKEFLILTQLGHHPDDFRRPGSTAISYFTSVTKETRNTRTVINLSLLAQELTRPDPEKRLSIKQFNELLKFRSQPCEHFYQRLEELLPSQTLGLQEDIDSINNLLNSYDTGKSLLTQANLIFKKLFTGDSTDHRLTRLAEKLAIKCYRECGQAFFRQAINTELLNRDWQKAPWYRKLFHVLSFGLYRVDAVTHVEEIKDTMGIDVNGDEFQLYFPQLMYLPPDELNSLGELEATYFKDVVNDSIDKIILMNPGLEDIIASEDDTSEEQTVLPISLPRTTLTLPSPVEKDEEEIDIEEDGEEDSALPSGTIVIDGKVESSTTEDNKEKSLPSGTMVINKAAPHVAETEQDGQPKKRRGLATRLGGGFDFFSNGTSAHSRVASIKTTLFRGDGSKGKSHAKQRQIVPMAEINFEPPVPGELEEEVTPLLQRTLG